MSIFSNSRLPFRSIVAAVLALTILAGTFGAPTTASADTAGQRSTRTLILTGLAAVAAIVLYNNYHHKQVAANTVVGYTRDGGVVYADGRIVYPDGTVLYTGNQSRQRCNYMGYGAQCGQPTYAYRGYYPNNYGARPYYGQNGYPGQYGYTGQNGYYGQPAYNPQPYYAPRPAYSGARSDRDDRKHRDRDDRKRHRHPNGGDDDNGNGGD